MNNLFIGPYRQSNNNGLCSLSILHHLASNLGPQHKLSCRNIYIDSVNIDNKNILCNQFENLETINFKPDTIIQHVPIDTIYVNKYIRNICIPIIDHNNINNQDMIRLATCDRILVDNIYSYELLLKILPHSSDIRYIHYNPIVLDGPKNASLGAYQHTTKMYFIGEYSENIDIIQDLILSFVIGSAENDNISLLLFLTDASVAEIQQVNSYIDMVYKALNICNIFPKIVCISTKLTLEQIINCHKSGDIYLSVNDGNKNALHINYAKHYAHQIIDWSNLLFEFKHKRNGKLSDIGYNVPLQSSLFSVITNYQNHTTLSTHTSTSIEQAIWD